jgi:pyruvate-ferredoxin/flavodoxin oxidoreductase
MCLSVFENLAAATPIHRFSVGITDDVRHASLPVKRDSLPSAEALPAGTRQCLLWGIGGDGTVGANKAAIKLIADHTNLHAQGYFSYDANKAGGLTLSHLRFGPTPFEAPYLITEAEYIACHNPTYVRRFNMLSPLRQDATFVLNCPWKTVDELNERLPALMRKQLAEKNAQFYVIDASAIARQSGIGSYINMVLQAVFFALSGVLDVNLAVKLLKDSIVKMYKRKGDEVIAKNIRAVDMSCDPALLCKVNYPRDAWCALVPTPDEEQRRAQIPRRARALQRGAVRADQPLRRRRHSGLTIPTWWRGPDRHSTALQAWHR